MVCGILVPWPGIGPRPTAVKPLDSQGIPLNHILNLYAPSYDSSRSYSQLASGENLSFFYCQKTSQVTSQRTSSRWERAPALSAQGCSHSRSPAFRDPAETSPQDAGCSLFSGQTRGRPLEGNLHRAVKCVCLGNICNLACLVRCSMSIRCHLYQVLEFRFAYLWLSLFIFIPEHQKHDKHK